MNESCNNIYKTARNDADLTIEQASELLHISPRTLSGYEACKPRPNDKIVLEMVKLYGTEWLGYEHFRTGSELGMKCLPPIKIEGLAKSVLVLQKETDDVDNIKKSMVRIACDDKVDHQEIDDWENISRELKEMAGAAMSVILSSNLAKEKRPSQMAV